MTYVLANNGHSAQVTLSNVPTSVQLTVFGECVSLLHFLTRQHVNKQPVLEISKQHATPVLDEMNQATDYAESS